MVIFRNIFFKNLFLLILICALIITVFGACTSTSERDINSVDSVFESPACMGFELFAKLRKHGSKYIFEQYSTQYSSNEPWVKLNDRLPMWFIGTEYKCLNDTKENWPVQCCKTMNEELFRFFTPKSMFDIGIVHVANPFGNVQFDNNKFITAYNDAYKNSALNVCEDIRRISEKTTKISNRYNNILSKYNEMFNIAKKRVKINYYNKSGCWFDKKELKNKIQVNISKNNLPYKRPVFPELTRSKLDELIESIDNYYDTRYSNSAFFKKLQETCSFLNVQCEFQKSMNIDYSLEYPSEVYVNNTNFAVPIEVIVNTINIRNMRPSNIRIRDDNLELLLSEGIIYLTNLSNRYLSLDNVAFYYNNEISSIQNSLDLPPHATKIEILFSKFRLKSEAISFENIDETKARKININYGFALKYRIVDLNKEITLYKTKKYNLFNLIRSNKN